MVHSLLLIRTDLVLAGTVSMVIRSRSGTGDL